MLALLWTSESLFNDVLTMLVYDVKRFVIHSVTGSISNGRVSALPEQSTVPQYTTYFTRLQRLCLFR